MPLIPVSLCKRHDLSKHELSPSEMNINSASAISIGYQHIAEKEEAKQGERYNSLTRGSCSGKLPNGNICLHVSLLFCKGCSRFNKKVYYCRNVCPNCFETHHYSLVCIP